MRIAPIGGGLIASQVYCSVVGLCFTLGVVEAKPPRQADIALCAVTGVSLEYHPVVTNPVSGSTSKQVASKEVLWLFLHIFSCFTVVRSESRLIRGLHFGLYTLTNRRCCLLALASFVLGQRGQSALHLVDRDQEADDSGDQQPPKVEVHPSEVKSRLPNEAKRTLNVLMAHRNKTTWGETAAETRLTRRTVQKRHWLRYKVAYSTHR